VYPSCCSSTLHDLALKSIRSDGAPTALYLYLNKCVEKEAAPDEFGLSLQTCDS
jgi:hypothetical protein